eukprot:PhF_6_TR31788/c0_g1_i1/m.46819
MIAVKWPLRGHPCVCLVHLGRNVVVPSTCTRKITIGDHHRSTQRFTVAMIVRMHVQQRVKLRKNELEMSAQKVTKDSYAETASLATVSLVYSVVHVSAAVLRP